MKEYGDREAGSAGRNDSYQGVNATSSTEATPQQASATTIANSRRPALRDMRRVVSQAPPLIGAPASYRAAVTA